MLALTGAFLGFVAASAIAAPAFVEETAGSGISHSYTGDFRYFVGGGVAVFDCDQDRVPDLYLAGGEGPAALYRNVSAPGGALRFTEVGAAGLTAVTGAYPLDIDADGILDLFVMRVGENVILRGQGDCRFARANEALNYDGGEAWTTAFAATWFAGDALPTLAVGNYTRPGPTSGTFGACQNNQLVRPAGSQYRAPVALTPSYCALSMLFTSWRGHGAPDLRVSNDRQYYPPEGSEQLWRVDATSARPYGVDDGWQPLSIWGMAIATYDVTGDGRPDYYLTSMADNKLRALSAAATAGALSPRYADNALAFGVTAHRPSVGDTSRPSTSWHAEFADVDNDGAMDLFVAKGNVEDMADFAIADPNALFMRDGATFVDVAPAAGLASTFRGRGAALVDFNMDGALDVVVLNRRAPAQVWRNAGPQGHWVQLDIRQGGANNRAIGAWLEVTPQSAAGLTVGPVQRRQFAVGGGHAGGQLTWRHIGLAAAEAALVTVRWPDGGTSQWRVGANSYYTLRRGDPVPVKGFATAIAPGSVTLPLD